MTYEDECYEDYPDRDEDEWGPCRDPECINPHPYHFRSECFTVEMAEDAGMYEEGR